jgi:hypothetical protein
MNTKNKPYDEEVWLEETTSEDLEMASGVERDIEDAYDRAYTSQFTIRPPTPPKNDWHCSTIGIKRVILNLQGCKELFIEKNDFEKVEEDSDIEANPYEFEDAMANQFYYLIHNDILESKLNELSEEDKEYMDYLGVLALKGK